MEFRNSIDTTGVNIPARIVDYVLQVTRLKGKRPEGEARTFNLHFNFGFLPVTNGSVLCQTT